MKISDEELDKWISNNMTPESKYGAAFIRMMENEKSKNVEIDHERMVDFVKSIDAAKKYLKDNCVNYEIKSNMFDVTNKNCRFEIIFDVIKFSSFDDLLDIIKRSSWMGLGVTNDDRVCITVEFWNVAKEKGGKIS